MIPESVEEMASRLAVPISLTRDEDDGDADRLRAAFLTRVCSLSELVFRRDTWPILEIGVSVGSEGQWRVRVVSMVLDRDTLTVGRTQSEHETDDRGLMVRPTHRESLVRAVHHGIVEHVSHETAENLYYKGTRLLDPHCSPTPPRDAERGEG